MGFLLLLSAPPAGTALGILCFILSAFCLFFFRDFDRLSPTDESLILSPGDGRILDVAVLDEGDYAGHRVIRIFLSIFDGHVQRSPLRGRVERIDYRKGVFFDARDPRAHVENEQNALTLSSEKGRVVVTQIAGLIARRIVCWVKTGQELKAGERLGLIRFGSQVDLFLPPTADVVIAPGARVVSGKTVVARWK